jgi:dihydrofolate synthase/folylpolyglutamate synthase
MTYKDAVAFMSGLRRFGMRLGNERIVELLRRIGDPQNDYGIAHVTGTKGKGSTTALIAAVLQAHGFRVGGYYSPYVYDLCERVQLNARLIPKRTVARHVSELIPHVRAIQRTQLGAVTEFELKTALAFAYFAHQKADYAAVEVGIGGRLDATNVVHPVVCVITNVGLDHTHILGDTHAKIAAEKSGIIKPGIPLITAVDEASALRVVLRRASFLRAPALRVLEGGGTPPANAIHWSGDTGSLSVVTPLGAYVGLRLRLMGTHQCVNAACAIGAVEQIAAREGFAIRADAVAAGLNAVELPGRFSVLRAEPRVVADGAHNALSARALAGQVLNGTRGRLLLVVGMLHGHDPGEFLRELAPHADVVFATQPKWRRALDVETVAAAARRYCSDVRSVAPPDRAARAALHEADGSDTILITGSFYTVGDVRPSVVTAPVRGPAGRARARGPRP